MKKLLKILVLIIIINFLTFNLQAKDNDSLKKSKIIKLFNKSSDLLYQSPERTIYISNQILSIKNYDSLFYIKPYVYRIMGIAYYNLSNLDSSIYYLNLSKQLFLKLKDTVNFSSIFADLGSSYLKLGDFDKALNEFVNSYNYFLVCKDSANAAKLLINMVIAAKKMEEYEKALNYQIEVMKNYSKFLDSISLASSYNNLGNLYKKVGNNNLSLKYYFKALNIFKKRKLHNKVAIIDNNIGIIYKLDRKYKKALHYYEESLRLKQELNDKYGVSITLNNIGEVYEFQKKYDYAIILYQRSLIIKKEIGYKKGIINTYVNLGRVFYKAKDYKNAKKNFLQAVKLGGKSYLSLSDAYLYLSKISKEEGRINESLDYLEDYAEIQDSVVNPARNKRINNIISRYELSKKDTTIQNLINFEKKSQKMISRSNSYLYALALILIIILVISYVFFSRLKVVSKLQNETEHKNKELEKTNLELERINKELERTKEKLNTEINERIKAETENEKNREQLKELYKKQKEMNDMKTRLIANITHEYRNPLTTISLKTDILKNENVRNKPELFNQQIELIQIEIDRMIKLLEDALTLNKRTSGLQKVHFERVDLLEFCNNLVNTTSELHSNDHKISVISNKEKEFFVNSDKKLLNSILTNLLDNAYKYSAKNSNITIEIIDNVKDFTIKVTDEGIGIPEEDKQWIFSSFHRCRNIGSIRGNGLGLSIVKMKVESLKGKVKFDSKENKGSTFSFTLPKVIQ